MRIPKFLIIGDNMNDKIKLVETLPNYNKLYSNYINNCSEPFVEYAFNLIENDEYNTVHLIVCPDIDFTDEILQNELFLNISSIIYPFSRFYCDIERLNNDPLENIGHGIIYNKSNNNLCERLLSDSEKDDILESYNLHHENLSKEVIDNGLIIDC